MQFIHSNKQYIERSMYLINPYVNSQEAEPLTMEAFVAPADFNPDAQELNIVKAFAAYPDTNKKYIFSVGASATTVLPSVAGRSYVYAENGGVYTTIASGTITWTVGSTKRHVIGINTNPTEIYTNTISSLWTYLSDKITSIGTLYSSSAKLKYIHAQNLESITSIGNNAFEFCPLIGILKLPNNITGYGIGGQFGNCTGLTSVDFNNASLISIGQNQFSNCTGLTSISIPNTVTTIGAGAFISCTGLTSISIPNTVTTIGAGAFAYCTNAVFNSNNLQLDNLSGILTSTFLRSKKLKSVDLSNSSITGLADNSWQGVFLECDSLTSIKLPATINYIGYNAFRDCASLVLFHIKAASPPIVNSYAFIGVNKTTCILHVPIGSLAAYQAAPYWNEFTNIIADL